ncbi:U32 family peptidase [Cellulosilyticum sp. I15G10I2]|uniref:U32 family peptidase n=1 Tax=Cellulosilyticum sp. I15G10I2 TaxID=1892843 RepID=UPI00085C5D04|nr:U32 family peptidase [Cellulosilyticum sp. I15G10I2]
MKTVELLAPVGKIENAYAAIENGADALFIGGKLFNARQYAENFTDEELEEIIRYSKLRGIQVYITVNTLIKEDEVSTLFNYLDYLNRLGVDAVISQDLAVASLVKKYFPELILHASTQMTAHSLEDVSFLETLGFKRIVLARELHLNEVKKITANSQVEVETFIHGALCFSYSGQCLMSSLIGGRSGNRGRCAQPCRMKYTLTKNNKTLSKEDYLLSLKDICTVEFLPELIACGIHSLKIEGRMKSPEYVASVVKTYRKYLDLFMNQKSYEVDQKDIEELKGIFNRGGFSTGYYFDAPNAKMITPVSPRHIGVKIGEVTHFSPKSGRTAIVLKCELNPGDGIEIIRSGRESVGAGISKHYKKGDTIYLDFDKYIDVGSEVYLTKNHQLLKGLRNTYTKSQKKVPIDLKVTSKVGEPIQIQATYKTLSINHIGEVLEKASSAPLTKDNAIKQLSKLGNTSFFLNKIEIDWDEEGYLSISKLNEMRRMALLKMEEKILESCIKDKRTYEPLNRNRHEEKKFWSANVKTIDQLKVCLEKREITEIYWEWQYDNAQSQEAYKLCHEANKAFYLALPYIMHDSSYKKFEHALIYWENTDIEGYLIRNYGEFNWLKSSQKEKHIDYTLNIMNNEAIALWHELGASCLTLSMEITTSEIQALRGNLERIVYGYIPVMTSKQCILRYHNQCVKKANHSVNHQLLDRKEAQWTIQTDCEACVVQILTDKPIVLKHLEEFKYTDIKSLRLNFNVETKEETQKVLEAYLSGEASKIKLIEGVSFKSIE